MDVWQAAALILIYGGVWNCLSGRVHHYCAPRQKESQSPLLPPQRRRRTKLTYFSNNPGEGSSPRFESPPTKFTSNSNPLITPLDQFCSLKWFLLDIKLYYEIVNIKAVKKRRSNFEVSQAEFLGYRENFFLAIAACPVLQKKDPRRGGGPINYSAIP